MRVFPNKSPLRFGLLVAAVVGLPFSFFSFNNIDDRDEIVDVRKDGRLQYKWFSPELPKAISFSGEKVPMERMEIREQLDRELMYNYYNQYSTLYILKLSERYFPIIEAILKENGVPEDFKFLCVAESALQNQTSRAGAVGFWQFMPATAPQYGLEVGEEVDERYHVEKATEAACKYFKQAYNKLGSWTAAAASYNMGQAGYNSMSSFQQMDNYYDLMLPDETMRYVFRILAFKLLLSNPEHYGYIVEKKDYFKPIKTRTVKVSSTIPDLAQFAMEQKSTYRKLKMLNPWLRDRKLTVKPGKTYEIAFPS